MEEVTQEKPQPYDMSEKYWLAFPAYSKEFAEAVMEHVREHVQFWNRSSISNAKWRAYRAYYNLDEEAHLGGPATQIMEAGEMGELLSVKVNQYRNLTRHQQTIANPSRPAWDPQARTADADSAKEVALARNILDYCVAFKRMEEIHSEALEASVVIADSYIALGWDHNAGPDGGGDIWAAALMPWEVVRERTRFYDDTRWHIFRRPENKWDWVAHFSVSDPEKAEKIANLDSGKLVEDEMSLETTDQYTSDQIPGWYVYSPPSKALPAGRMALVTLDGIVLFDGPYPYRDAELVIRVCPSQFLGTSEAYGDSWSLLVLNDAYNAVLSTMLTRADAFGIPNVTTVEGTEFEVDDVSGLGIIKRPPGQEKPDLLDFFQIPPEANQLLGILEKAGETLSGVNSVARGQPAQNITSGSMAALVDSMSSRFNSALEAASLRAWERMGTGIIKLYQCMADAPQLIAIAGKDKTWSVTEFTKDKLKRIMGVTVKQVSALAKSTAGKADMADKLLSANQFNSPQEYLNVLATGNLESFFSGPVNTLNTIKAENERMLRGEPARAIEYENHQLHIREHMEELTPEIRANPNIYGAFQAHLKEHYDLWARMSREAPDMLAAMGVPPLPDSAALGQAARMMQGMGGAPPGEGPAPQKQPNTEPRGKGGKPGPAPTGAPGSVPGRMPSMPEPAEPPTE